MGNNVSREKRRALLQEIQECRESKVVVYVTGDRPPFPSQIATDAVLPLYRHLLPLADGEPAKRIDLILYSQGGDVGVPWRIVTMMREFCAEFGVLIPYKAYSAATMIALGADEIVMGRKAELSPIDPTLMRLVSGDATVPPPQISVEDVSSYVTFMRERANINDQSALAQVVSQLATHLTPPVLGQVNRAHSHIRLLARKLLTSRREKTEEDRISAIVEALTEKMYAHGHAIGRKEATELGLSVRNPDANLESLLWQLYEEYERMLELHEPLDPEAVLVQQHVEEHTQQWPIAVIESEARLDVFRVSHIFRRRRQVPPNPQITINLNLVLPPSVDPNSLPQNAQQALQQILNQAAQHIRDSVQQEIARQSPVVGLEARQYGGKWREETRGEA
jgi:hypothetical protein